MRFHKAVHTGFCGMLASAIACGAQAGSIEGSAPTPMPAITYVGADGAQHTLTPGKNKLTLLHFWATWCIPCLKELPTLDKAYGVWKSQGVEVVPLVMDENNTELAHSFYSSHSIHYLPLEIDKDNKALKAADVSSLPMTVFINSKGQEVGRSVGTVNWLGTEAQAFVGKYLR